MDALVDRIFLRLSKHFPPSPSQTNADVPEQPLRALQLIMRLRKATVATKSYGLFKTIMQSNVVEAKKMEAARLVLHPSYQQKLFLPVRDPKHIHNFLHYYNNLRTERRDHATLVMPAADPVSNNPTLQY